MPFRFTDIAASTPPERKPLVPIDFSGLRALAERRAAAERQQQDLAFSREQEQQKREQFDALRQQTERFHEDQYANYEADRQLEREQDEAKAAAARQKKLLDSMKAAQELGWNRDYDGIEDTVGEQIRQAGGKLQWVDPNGNIHGVAQKVTPDAPVPDKPAPKLTPALPGDMPAPVPDKPVETMTDQEVGASLDQVGANADKGVLPGDIPVPEKPAKPEQPKMTPTQELVQDVKAAQKELGPGSSVTISKQVKPDEKGPAAPLAVSGQEDPRDSMVLEAVMPDGRVIELYSPKARREQHTRAFADFAANAEKGIAKPGDKSDWQTAAKIVMGSGKPYQAMVQDQYALFNQMQKYRYGLEGARMQASARAATATSQQGRYQESAWDKGKQQFGTRVPKVKTLIENYESSVQLVDLLKDPNLTRQGLAQATGLALQAAGHGKTMSEGEQVRILGKDSLYLAGQDFLQRNLEPDSPVPDGIRIPMLRLALERKKLRSIDIKREYDGTVKAYFDARQSRERGDEWSKGFRNGAMEQFSQVYDDKGNPLYNDNDFEQAPTQRQQAGTVKAAKDPSLDDPAFLELLGGEGN